MQPLSFHNRFVRLVPAVCLFFSSWAGAQQGLGLAGFEIANHNSYLYLGGIQSASASLGSGLAYRTWLDAGTYRYEKSGTQIDARYWRASAAAGYQNAGERGWWAGYLGAGYQQTSLSPDDPENASRGGKIKPFLQLEGETQLAPTLTANLASSYTFGSNAYWLRGRVFKSLYASRRVGAEMILHGDPDYQATQIGGLFVVPLDRNVMTIIKAGIRTGSGTSSTPYGGLEFTKPF
ncbi:cellulose biosynthesis protein BcsS [Sulfuricystis multivorans]|uniref:cellulose biosynthesis protein BcsS n=1 Tax=Sulfuricystis multivorans TaxID=2211108 RepID=UPI000F8226AE|nr:cellulose biosynthesis protein BcsS [Sulfuricystis multivorans]